MTATPNGDDPHGIDAPGPRTIDVLIPVYNGARWLRQSVDSIRNQTHRDLRIHVVDDGSTDETPNILAAMAQADARISVHRRANGGIVEALTDGLTHCRANWLARHDADDVAEPQRLERQLDYLLAHPDCVAVGAMARHIDAEGVALGTVIHLHSPSEADAGWLPAREPYVMHPLLLVRRSAFDAAGGYRHSPASEDSDLYWRLHELGRMHNLPEILAAYRLHDANVSSASIVNGRLMAVGSQLAALSARRRAATRPDLAFEARLPAQLRAAGSLAGMLAVVAERIDADERPDFELTVATKLLELAGYQPFWMEPADVAFVAAALGRLRTRPGVSRTQRAHLDHLAVRTAVRYWRNGRRSKSLQLLPAARGHEFLARLALATPLGRALRAVAGRRPQGS